MLINYKLRKSAEKTVERLQLYYPTCYFEIVPSPVTKYAGKFLIKMRTAKGQEAFVEQMLKKTKVGQ